MTIIYIIGILIILVILFSLFTIGRRNKSPYFKLKKRLEEDLLQSTFAGDWQKRQEIYLQLIWLKTINEVERSDIFNKSKKETDISMLASLSIEDIKFPLNWSLNDFYTYPFAKAIISAYGNVLEKNEYGMFKPDNILPVPKNYIRKAIKFMFDYFALSDPIYKIHEKQQQSEDLNKAYYFLEATFINTGSKDIPKSRTENYSVGSEIKENMIETNEYDEFELCDWRSNRDWLLMGFEYLKDRDFDSTFKYYNHVRKLNPKDPDLISILPITYITKAEWHYEKGEKEFAIENYKKAAELGSREAKEWLKSYSIS